MVFIFELIDCTGRKIHLTDERYKHIIRHLDMQNKLEDIQQTLVRPLKITHFDQYLVYYYRYYKDHPSKAKYLRVIVKYLNGKGFVVTSYFVEVLL
ncbi:MAG: hypothetical protein Q8L34_06415 [Candidatus Woesearchaeota archaeon]|nr:hypothetical protein [Candidatus Woesearchaeota archaeon]